MSKKESIRSFCRFIDTYNGEMTIRGGLIYDVNGVIIYRVIFCDTYS